MGKQRRRNMHVGLFFSCPYNMGNILLYKDVVVN
jgi:hypothetical protein